MKKNTYVLVISLLLFAPSIVLAAANIPLPGGTGLPDSSVGEVIAKVTRFITALIAVLAILMIVVSGILYITSAGESEKISQAKSWLTYSIIGLVVSLLGYVIVIAVGQALGAW